MKRGAKIFLSLAGGYMAYLMALGPYLALLGTGKLDFVSRGVQDSFFLGAWPIIEVPGVRTCYLDYLDWWYDDGIDPPTGW